MDWKADKRSGYLYTLWDKPTTDSHKRLRQHQEPTRQTDNRQPRQQKQETVVEYLFNSSCLTLMRLYYYMELYFLFRTVIIISLGISCRIGTLTDKTMASFAIEL